MCCMDFSFITLLCSRLFFLCFFLTAHCQNILKRSFQSSTVYFLFVVFGFSFPTISPVFHLRTQKQKKDTFMDQCCHNILGYFSLFPLSHFPLKHHNGILIQLGQRMELLSHRKIDSGLVNKNTATGATESISEDDTSLQSQCLSK